MVAAWLIRVGARFGGQMLGVLEQRPAQSFEARIEPLFEAPGVVDGGRGTVVDDGTDRQVRVERVEPGKAVRFSWWPTGGPEQASTVELVVLPTHQGSRLLVTEVMASASVQASVQTPRTGLAWEMRVVCLWAATVCLASV